MKFNLKNSLMKEAMGSFAYRYRDQIKWGSLEDVVRGNEIAAEPNDQTETSKTWADLIKEIPSLKGVVYQIIRMQDKLAAVLKGRYNISDEEIKRCFQMFVGFHPIYGCYARSIGPYSASELKTKKPVRKFLREQGVSEEFTPENLAEAINSGDDRISSAAKCIKAEQLNNYSYFSKRYRIANEEELRKSLERYFREMMEIFSKQASLSGTEIKLDAGDVQLKIKVATGEADARGLKTDVDKKWTINTLDPKTEKEAAALTNLYDKNNPTIMGDGSEFSLNARGLSKVMEAAARTGNWTSIYNQAIEETAKKNNITPENMQAIMQSDTKIIKAVINLAHKIQNKLIDSGDPAASLMKPVPPLNTRVLLKGSKPGGQAFSALRTNPNQFHLAELKLEIHKTANEIGTYDPTKLTAALLEAREDPVLKRVMATGVITEDIVKQFVNKISKERLIRNKGKIVGRKSNKQLLDEAQETLNVLRNNSGNKVGEGFKSFEIAAEQCEMNAYSPGVDAIDPKHKVALSHLYAPPMGMFSREGNNATTDELNQWRVIAEATGVPEIERINREVSQLKPPKKMIWDIAQTPQEVRPPEAEVTEEDIRSLPELSDEELAKMEGTSNIEKNQTVVPETTTPALEEETGVEDVVVEEGDEAEADEGVAKEIGVKQPMSTLKPDFPVIDIPEEEITQETTPKATPIRQPPIQIPQIPQPEIAQETQPPAHQLPTQKEKRKKPIKNVNIPVAKTLMSLIKIAEDLDNKGKDKASEEIHKVIRKYQSRIK